MASMACKHACWYNATASQLLCNPLGIVYLNEIKIKEIMKKSKRLMLAAILMAMPLCAGAQLSELIEFPSPSAHVTIKTIVRNFNEYYDIIAVYGYDTMTSYVDTIAPRTTFYKRKLATGEIKHLCELEGGYCVNDFKFN